MEFVKLETKYRGTTGKGPARRMRAAGLVPAVVYGPGIATMTLAVAPRALTKALTGPLKINTVLDISVEGAPADAPSSIHAIVHEHQYDPVTRALLHVDFFLVDPTKALQLSVPLIVRGRSQGEQAGGVLEQYHRSLLVSCLPDRIPERFEVDVTELEINTSIRAADLPMPEGVEIAMPPETPLVGVVAPRAEEVAEEESAAAEGEAAASVEEEKQDEKQGGGEGKKKE